MTVKEAAKIGVNACIDKLGRDFVIANRHNSSAAFGESDGRVFCWVGVDDTAYSSPYDPDVVVLDSVSEFKYFAECHVSLTDGMVTFGNSRLPGGEANGC